MEASRVGSGKPRGSDFLALERIPVLRHALTGPEWLRRTAMGAGRCPDHYRTAGERSHPPRAPTSPGTPSYGTGPTAAEGSVRGFRRPAESADPRDRHRPAAPLQTLPRN